MALVVLYTTYLAWLAHKDVLNAKEQKDKVAKMVDGFADLNKHPFEKLID